MTGFRRTTCPVFTSPLVLVCAAIVGASLFSTHLSAAMTESDWKKLSMFVGIEVPSQLFLKFLPIAPLFWFVGTRFPWAPRALWLLTTVMGLYKQFLFINWYRGVAHPFALFFSQVEKLAQDPEKGAQIWFDDYVWLALVVLVAVFAAEGRGRIKYVLLWIASVFMCGPDVTLAILLASLAASERENTGRASKRIIWLYALLAFGALASWLPNLLCWVKLRGTVAGQYEAGMEAAPIGPRSTDGIMLASFSLAAYAMPRISVVASSPGSYNSPSKSFSDGLSWVCRGFFLCLITSNVAVALAALLLAREYLPNASFAAGDDENDEDSHDD